MRVRCINNTGENLPTQLFSHFGWNNAMEFPQITIGKEYVVYSILFIDDHPFYMICDDDYDGEYLNYPNLLLSNLFEIIDNTKSKFWVTEKKYIPFKFRKNKDVGFMELLRDEYFYGKLVEGYKNEIEIFSSIKNKIDKENGIH